MLKYIDAFKSLNVIEYQKTRFCVDAFMFTVAYLTNTSNTYSPLRHYKRSAIIKIMHIVLNPFSYLSLLCICLFNGLLHPIHPLHHCFTHSKFGIFYIHHQSSVPGKSQDDVRLHPALPYRPASCYFGSSASFPQNPAKEQRYWIIRYHELGWICESTAFSRSYTDLPLSMSFLPLHITHEES